MDKKKQHDIQDVLITEEEGGKPPIIQINEGPTQPEERVQFNDELEKAEEKAAEDDEDPQPMEPARAGSFALGMKTFMSQALELAKQAGEAGEVPVGAIVLKDGKVVSRAGNNREGAADPSGHAELIALREAARILGDWRLTDCELYVTLEPCPMCLGMILQTKLKKLVFGAFDPVMGAVESAAMVKDMPGTNRDLEVYGGILEEECSGLLKGFFGKRRKK